MLLGLTPAQIKEYEIIEQFSYFLVVDDDWSNAGKYESLEDVKYSVSESFGLNFSSNKLSLIDDWNNTVIRGGY